MLIKHPFLWESPKQYTMIYYLPPVAHWPPHWKVFFESWLGAARLCTPSLRRYKEILVNGNQFGEKWVNRNRVTRNALLSGKIGTSCHPQEGWYFANEGGFGRRICSRGLINQRKIQKRVPAFGINSSSRVGQWFVKVRKPSYHRRKFRSETSHNMDRWKSNEKQRWE